MLENEISLLKVDQVVKMGHELSMLINLYYTTSKSRKDKEKLKIIQAKVQFFIKIVMNLVKAIDLIPEGVNDSIYLATCILIVKGVSSFRKILPGSNLDSLIGAVLFDNLILKLKKTVTKESHLFAIEWICKILRDDFDQEKRNKIQAFLMEKLSLVSFLDKRIKKSISNINN